MLWRDGTLEMGAVGKRHQQAKQVPSKHRPGTGTRPELTSAPVLIGRPLKQQQALLGCAIVIRLWCTAARHDG